MKAMRSWTRTVKLGWQIVLAAPGPFLAFCLLQTANGIRGCLYPLAVSKLVNALVQGHGAVLWALAIAGVFLLEFGAESLMTLSGNWLALSIDMKVKGNVMLKIAGIPLERFFDSAFNDKVLKSVGDMGMRISTWLFTIGVLFRSIAFSGGMLGVVAMLGGGPGVAGALIVGVVPLVLRGLKLAQEEAERVERVAKWQRFAGAWASLLTDRRSAPEVRIYNLQAWAEAKWRSHHSQSVAENMNMSKRRLKATTISEAANALAYGTLLALGTASIVGRPGAAGAFAGILQAAAWLQGSISNVVGAVVEMHEHAKVIDLLAEIFDEEELPEVAAKLAVGSPVSVSAENVAFRYPNGSGGADTIDNVSFYVSKGQVVALVGPNGAGKSTLAALVLGLYKPDQGRIQVGEYCTNEGPWGSAVFQEFSRLTLTIRDNIGFGNMELYWDDEAIRRALRMGGSDLADGDLDKWLGVDFGGRDLSGGQWLRVAIARGLLSEKGLMILDEPTAAIDPLEEVDLVERLLSLGAGRTTFVISHRLGFARKAHRILVMDRGRIVEDGTHEELLAAKGLYAEMWRAQASWYRSPEHRAS